MKDKAPQTSTTGIKGTTNTFQITLVRFTDHMLYNNNGSTHHVAHRLGNTYQ